MKGIVGRTYYGIFKMAASVTDTSKRSLDEVDNPSKRQRKVQKTCIIHTVDTADNLTSPQKLDSWQTLLQAAKIRNHKPILDLSSNPDEIPSIFYHRQCRSIFTLKKSLQKSENSKSRESTSLIEPTKRTSLRKTPTSSSRVYEAVCIFCEKSKYIKGKQSREELIKCTDMRSDQTIRRVAMDINDERMLAIVSRELVAAEAHYHRSCYRNYTRTREAVEDSSNSSPEIDAAQEYAEKEAEAYKKLFQYIRDEVSKPIAMTEVTNKLASFMSDLGVAEIKDSTKKHIRRNLEGNFEIFQDMNRKLFVIPHDLSRFQLAQGYLDLEKKLGILEKKSTAVEDVIHKAGMYIRESVKRHEINMTWPPKAHELNESSINLPKNLKTFLHTVLTGEVDTENSNPSSKVQRLINSFGQDFVYALSGRQQKPPKQILLTYAIKSLTNNVELIQLINRCGHGVSYSQIEEIDTALCLQKMASLSNDDIPLPENILPHVTTTLAWDNIDRLEETLSGGGTSHRVNGIVVQQSHYGPQLPPMSTQVIAKEKKRTVEPQPMHLPVYNAGERCGPPARRYIDVSSSEVSDNAEMKNLIWLLARLHSRQNQTVSGWTGFNISVRQDINVIPDTIGYLPTINAPATNMSTVLEILSQSLKIKDTLHLESIAVVFDQALYAKAVEIIWKHQEKFSGIIPRLGVFHTICTFLSIIGKRFQDAGLRDLCIEAGVIAEGSVAGVLDGHRYNRAVRLHKLMYEALMRLAWKGFPMWLEDNHEDKRHIPNDATDGLQNLCSDVCKDEFETVMAAPLYSHLSELFNEYLQYLRNDNGSLSAFWMSYKDMIEILLGLLRGSREGNWKLHLTSIRAMIPWCFAYDNVNYARYLPVYLAEMSHLQFDHPEIHEHFESGCFSVQKGDENPFGRIPVDQTCEETVNKDTQTPGGTKGFSLKPGAVSRYYMVAEYRSIFLRQLKDMLHLNNSEFTHPDLQSTRISRDEADVKALEDMLENNWINPFCHDQQDLVCLSTGKLAPSDVEDDLFRALEVGKDAYKSFSKERLESSPSKLKFHDKITKQKFEDIQRYQ